jgi:hypothetical protein
MRDIGKHSNDDDDEEKPTAEDRSLPGKYGEIFRKVQQALRRFRANHESEQSKDQE